MSQLLDFKLQLSVCRQGEKIDCAMMRILLSQHEVCAMVRSLVSQHEVISHAHQFWRAFLLVFWFVHKIIKTVSKLFRTEVTEGRTGFVSVTLQCWFLQLI